MNTISGFEFSDDEDEEDDVFDSPGPVALNPAEIERRLIQLGHRINTEPESALLHAGQISLSEWRGAGVIVTSDQLFEPEGMIEASKLVVRTAHALPITWLFMEFWDSFSGHLDAGNKYGFYGDLASAALETLAREQPDPDYRTILQALLARGFYFLAFLRSQECLPPDSMVVIHSTTNEGQQIRIDAATGDTTT
jgi:hypothetical protein